MKRPPTSRGGYAMVLVLVFLVLMLSLWASPIGRSVRHCGRIDSLGPSHATKEACKPSAPA